MLELVTERGSGRTVGPTEIARALGGDKPEGWGPLMPAVRLAAIRLMKDGRLMILRKGRPVDPDDFKGVYRLTVPRNLRRRQQRIGVAREIVRDQADPFLRSHIETPQTLPRRSQKSPGRRACRRSGNRPDRR